MSVLIWWLFSFVSYLNVIIYLSYVLIAGNLVTSRGPATAVEFGLTLVGVLLGIEERAKVAEAILYPL